MTIELIITDFDGVILDSNGAKLRAFEKCFSIFPAHLEEITNYHLDNLGHSRFEKFEHIYRHILKRGYTDSDKRQISQRFEGIVYSEVVVCREVTGATAFLNTFVEFVPIVVISATPDAELIRIIRERGLDRYFSDVIGAGTTKTEAIKQMLDKYKVNAGNAVFIGDTNGDLHAARLNHVPFIGRKDRESFNSGVTRVVSDLNDIARLLRINKDDKSVDFDYL